MELSTYGRDSSFQSFFKTKFLREKKIKLKMIILSSPKKSCPKSITAESKIDFF